jgi:hypothetical protein
MDVRDLTKSALTLPWAISMFGVQQVANLMASRSSTDRVAGAAKAFDVVADATAQHLDGWRRQTYQVGNAVQRTLIDLLTLHAPEVDSSALMRMAAELQSGPMFQAFVKYGLPPVGWLDSLLVSRKDAPAVAQEFANKLYVITLVTQVHSQLGLHDGDATPLSDLVLKAGDVETFPRLWAIEGLGNYAGDRALAAAGSGHAISGLLSDPSAALLPPWSLTMLHAGVGMSFAKHVLKRLDSASAADAVRAAIAEFVSLCRRSSRDGYAGAALESLGLATRTLYPNLMRLLDAQIPDVEPELHGYFWHGAGRAMYFDPMNMLPSVNAPWRAIRRLDEEAPHDLARRNVLSGLAWALTVVNMRQPTIMETFLQHHGQLAAMNDAFVDGVTSALLMRYDTTREDAQIAPFVHHVPHDGDPLLASLWEQAITAPCERALRDEYADLAGNGRLEQLFHHRPAR